MRREPRRWRTSFGRFVRSTGVDSLAEKLSTAGQPVTRKAIYNWLAGDHAPRPHCAAAIVQISRGRIVLEDVYRHRQVVRSSGPRTI